MVALYCLIIMAASLVGGWAPFVGRLTHRRMELLVSVVAGAMLGVGLLHLLPHAIMARVQAEAGSSPPSSPAALTHDLVQPVLLWLLAGFLAMFLVERFFRFHHHDAPAPEPSDSPAPPAPPGASADHDHGDGACPDRGRSAVGATADHRHRLTWAGAAIGLTLHSLLEGVALAAAVAAELGHGPDDPQSHVTALAGFSTFLVIALHKPLDALTLSTLLAAGRWSAAARQSVNVAFSLVVPVGAMLFAVGLAGAGGDHGHLLSAALAVSAGTFLCISLSDLLPELQFHQHDRVKLTLAVLLGLAVAWAAAMLESGAHGH